MTRAQSTSIRWIKFNAVGGLGISIQLAVLGVSTALLHLDYLPATGLAVEAAVIHNFLWHQRFTWADRSEGGSFARFFKFNLTTGASSILGNLALMRLLVGQWKMSYLVANVITIASCSIANFLLSDRIVFRAGH